MEQAFTLKAQLYMYYPELPLPVGSKQSLRCINALLLSVMAAKQYFYDWTKALVDILEIRLVLSHKLLTVLYQDSIVTATCSQL